MHSLRVALFFAAVAPGLAVDDGMPAPALAGSNLRAGSAKRADDWVFSLWPKAFQKNPRLEFNVVTEFTAEGRKSPGPTRQSPAYYVAETGRPYNGGLSGPDGDLDLLSSAQLQAALRRVLGENGYREAEGTGPAPTLAIIYQFGSYAFNPPASVAEPNPGDAADTPVGNPSPAADPAVLERDIRRALLNRALLLGGQKFAALVADAMDRVDYKAMTERAFVAPEGGEDFIGSVGALLPNPFERLRARSAEMERLVDELFSSSYFVVASAYDYQALAHGRRRLLWRTKMSVNSLGVNMTESLPSLIASAGPYLGRETRDPVQIAKRISREGYVEVGTPTVR